MFKPERILVPTDFSEKGAQSSKIAVKQAVLMAEQSDSEIIFLHVITEDISRKPLFFLDDEKIGELKKKMREHYKGELKTFARKYIGDKKIKYKELFNLKVLDIKHVGKHVQRPHDLIFSGFIGFSQTINDLLLDRWRRILGQLFSGFGKLNSNHTAIG